MDYYAVLETFDQNKMISWNRSLTLLSGKSRFNSVNLALLKKTIRYDSVRQDSSGTSNFLGNVDLDRNHVSLPSWNSGQAWRGRLHFDVILFLVNGEHPPGLAMQNELCPTRASPCDKILVKTSDAPLSKKVEYCGLLNVRYNLEVREIVLNRLRITSGQKLVELSQQSQLIELRDNTAEFRWIQFAEWVGAMNDFADFLYRHSTFLE